MAYILELGERKMRTSRVLKRLRRKQKQGGGGGNQNKDIDKEVDLLNHK